ncbi:Zinc finger protein 58 [Trichostrongylus colubriformis]|uniref:Zinc finger protein 58 n=1 Tax=Trichostrongylus colubriformis TaxID=6319 RepID=A0AAN8FTK0_TRICO
MVEIAEMPSIIVDEPSNCPQCPKTFANVRLLQQHQQMFHSDKSFICEICGKAFRFRSNLAEHRSVHTALKPYVCKYCGKSSRLKGNLTKHILKHHKKEQNEQIGKDDIIIKKGKKSVKDPAAVDFLEKSMIVMAQNTTAEGTTPCLLPKEETNDQERSILISLGLDYSHSLDLRDSPEASASPENGTYSSVKPEYIEDQPYGSPLPANTVGGETSLAALIASVGTPPHATNNKTQCSECGKHFRKSSSLHVHMTLNHGFPPPESTGSSEEKTSECEATADEGCLRTELRAMRSLVCDLKAQIADMRQTQSSTRTEQMLSGMDTRIGRLEKQLEVALNSIYTLVQLTTGMNNNVTRFREDAVDQLKSIRAHLDSVSV